SAAGAESRGSAAGSAGPGEREGPRIRSGRSAMIRKASARPPTTDPATKINALPKRLSIVKLRGNPRARTGGGAPGRGCSFVYNAPPPARYEIAPRAQIVRA